MMTLADQNALALYYDAGGDKDGFLLRHKATVFYQRITWVRSRHRFPLAAIPVASKRLRVPDVMLFPALYHNSGLIVI
jgi:hypothetical protein